MRRLNVGICLATDNFQQSFMGLVWKPFTCDSGSQDDIYAGVRLTIICKVMVGVMVSREMLEIIID